MWGGGGGGNQQHFAKYVYHHYVSVAGRVDLQWHLHVVSSLVYIHLSLLLKVAL